MKKRNLIAVFLLAIFTFGIYPIVWLVKTRREINERSQTGKIASVWQLFGPVFAFAIVMILFAIVIAMGNDGSSGEGLNIFSNNPVFNISAFVLLALAGLVAIAMIVVPLVWFYKYSQVLQEVSNQQVSIGFAYGLFIVLSILGVYVIWMIIIQNELNKLADGVTPSAPAVPPASTTPTEPTPPVSPTPPTPPPSDPNSPAVG